MDCEKFESTLLDELYDELDEVTSAAAKRHVGGCARCATLLSGMKATRRVAVLPLEEPPADLEDRILAAAKEAQKVVPIGRRVSRAVSWAGSWAMRPQTAMAALFLLTTGFGALLLKGKHAAPTSAMTVSDQGEPVASVTADTLARPALAEKDDSPKEAKAAPATVAQPASPSPQPNAPPSLYAQNDGVVADGLSKGGGSGAAAPSPQGRVRLSAKDEGSRFSGLESNEHSYEQSAAPMAAPSPHRSYAAPPGAVAAAPSPAAAPPPAAPAQSPAARPSVKALATDAPALKQQGPGGAAGFDGAMGAYNTGDYTTSARLFDALAASGDLNAALWAARSVREGSGCAQAVGRFDQVSRAGIGTTPGYDATFEGGRCYRLLGQWDVARQRFAALLTVPSYFNKANGELAAMGPKGAAKTSAGKASQQQQGAATPQAAPVAPAKPASDAY
jgi:hypothetical protein